MISTIRLVSTVVFIGLSETNTIGYYGPVKISDITATATPLLVWR
jgi:hypothetical protein